MSLKKIDVFPNANIKISEPARIMTDRIMKVLCSKQRYISSNIFFEAVHTHKQNR